MRTVRKIESSPNILACIQQELQQHKTMYTTNASLMHILIMRELYIKHWNICHRQSKSRERIDWINVYNIRVFELYCFAAAQVVRVHEHTCEEALVNNITIYPFMNIKLYINVLNKLNIYCRVINADQERFVKSFPGKRILSIDEEVCGKFSRNEVMNFCMT